MPCRWTCTSLCYCHARYSAVFVFVVAAIRVVSLPCPLCLIVGFDRVRSTTCFPVHPYPLPTYPLGQCSTSLSSSPILVAEYLPHAQSLYQSLLSLGCYFENRHWLLHGQYTYVCGIGVGRPVTFCSPWSWSLFPSFGYPSAHSTVTTCITVIICIHELCTITGRNEEAAREKFKCLLRMMLIVMCIRTLDVLKVTEVAIFHDRQLQGTGQRKSKIKEHKQMDPKFWVIWGDSFVCS